MIHLEMVGGQFKTIEWVFGAAVSLSGNKMCNMWAAACERLKLQETGERGDPVAGQVVGVLER